MSDLIPAIIGVLLGLLFGLFRVIGAQHDITRRLDELEAWIRKNGVREE